MGTITRRRFAALAAAGAAAPFMAGIAGRSALADTRMRLFWWGNPERDKRTLAVVDLYQKKNADTRIDAESLSWNDYWPKMATQAAGRNLADAVQMDYRYLFEYARRQQLEPLDSFVGKELDLSQFDAAFLESGKVDGKLYAIPLGGNSTACYCDMVRLRELGVPVPKADWTFDDLRRIAQEVKRSGKEGVWGVADKGLWEPALEIFMRQRGKGLYDEASQLAFNEEDITEFFALWDGMRKEGLTPPADITARDIGGLDNLPLVGKRAVIDFAHSNQIVGLQALTPNELDMTTFPYLPDGKPGQYLKPAMQLSIARTSQNKAAAAKFGSFFVTDLDAASILRVERGVPGDRRVRESLLAKADPLEKKMLDYMTVVTKHVGPLPPPPPKGAGEIEGALRRIYPQVAFGRMSVKEAAAQFYGEAKTVLRRA